MEGFGWFEILKADGRWPYCAPGSRIRMPLGANLPNILGFLEARTIRPCLEPTAEERLTELRAMLRDAVL